MNDIVKNGFSSIIERSMASEIINVDEIFKRNTFVPDPSITIEESWEAMDLNLRQGNFANGNSSCTRTFIVNGTNDETKACYQAFGQAPDFVKNPYHPDKSIPKSSATVSERCSETKWKITVSYSLNSSSGTSSDRNKGGRENEISFDCSAGTMHMLRPYDQVCEYSHDGKMTNEVAKTIPINWNGIYDSGMEATGVDIPTSEIRERYTKYMRYSEVTSTKWKHNILKCFGRINNKKFKGWDPGEVLFIGCSYSTPTRDIDYVAVTFEFLIRLNESSTTIAGKKIGSKYGHDYIWAVQGRNGLDNIDKVKYIFKARVYKDADFKILGI